MRKIEIPTTQEVSKTFRVVKKATKGNWGTCDWEKREITLDPGVEGAGELTVLVHEVIHAACPDLSEDAVTRIERAVMRAALPYLRDQDG